VNKVATKKELGTQVVSKQNTWVQTERAAHEAWAKLAMNSPRAAALMHHLVANMGSQNAVVVNQKTLSKMLGCTVRTVQRAVADLVADRWIQAVNLGGAGTVNAYVINDQIAWGEKRELRPRLSMFSARVIADSEDQDALTLERTELRRLPMLYPGERQLPTGPGEDPPSQPSLTGLEADLPAVSGDNPDPWAHLRGASPEQLAQEREDMRLRYELEKRGQKRLTD